MQVQSVQPRCLGKGRFTLHWQKMSLCTTLPAARERTRRRMQVARARARTHMPHTNAYGPHGPGGRRVPRRVDCRPTRNKGAPRTHLASTQMTFLPTSLTLSRPHPAIRAARAPADDRNRRAAAHGAAPCHIPPAHALLSSSSSSSSSSSLSPPLPLYQAVRWRLVGCEKTCEAAARERASTDWTSA